MTAAPSGAAAVAELAALLAVERIDRDLFRGRTVADDAAPRLFGGQVVAQALAAAIGAVEDGRPVHSLHGYFMRAGDPRRPVLFRVARDFDGGSFANRRVVASQDGAAILNLLCSFHRPEAGFAHARALPDLPGPELAAPLGGPATPLPPSFARRLAAFDVRVARVEPRIGVAGAVPEQCFWFRLRAPAPRHVAAPAALLAYASDFALITTAALPHGVDYFSPRLQAASLDHALWFHEPPVPDEWLCYVMDSPWAGHARGLARGAIFDRAGTLVASVAQEGLMRPRAG